MLKNFSFPLALLFTVALVACGEDEDTGDTADSGDTGVQTGDVDLSLLTWTRSCTDVYFAKVDPGGSLLLNISSGQEMTEQAYNTGVTQTLSIDLATAPERVTLEQGVGLEQLPCNDDIDGQPETTKTWSGKSGTVTFNITSTGSGGSGEWEADGEVTLTDVVLESPLGETLAVPNETLSGGVGWYPG